MLEHDGVEYIDAYCVDNALARVADPHFVGLASMRASDVCVALCLLHDSIDHLTVLLMNLHSNM